jgi:hypothetical protein
MPTHGAVRYLNDHLAGSAAALDLIDALVHRAHGTARGELLAQLRLEIEADQVVLRDVMVRYGAEQSRLKQAAAWLVEKLGEAKLAFSGVGETETAWLYAWELLELGIEGKAALWRVLAAASAIESKLRGVDYAELEARAQDQLARVERERILAGAAVFAPDE